MAPSQPFNKEELRVANTTASVYRKSMEILEEVKRETEAEFNGNLKTLGGQLSPARVDYGADWLVYKCELRPTKGRGPIRAAGFGIYPDDDGLHFFFYVWGSRGLEMDKLCAALHWDAGDQGKMCSKDIKLQGNPKDIVGMKILVRRESGKLGEQIHRFGW